jgi:hypothetical protein
MGQGLSGAPQTYTRLKDFVSGPIPEPYGEQSLNAVSSGAFECFIDDDFGAHASNQSQFDFLHYWYFPRLSWARLTLNGSKSGFFLDEIRPLGFLRDSSGLRPSINKVQAISDYPTPTNIGEVEAFVHLTTYLRHFIPGRAEHARILKEAAIYEVRPEGPLTTMKNGIANRVVAANRTRRRKPVKDIVDFRWTSRQENSFAAIKEAIVNNAVFGGDATKQYHLATDASGKAFGGVLFQLVDSPPGTNATPATRKEQRIIMFISKPFSPAETRYSATEREALAVLRCLEEICWLVVGSPFPTKVYTDHQALISLLRKDDAHGRIAGWQTRLSEYDVEYIHIPGKENGIADGLSRIPRSVNGGSDTKDFFLLSVAEGEEAVIQKGWEDWLRDDWYGSITHYKLTGDFDSLKGKDGKSLDKNWRRLIRHAARRYNTLPDSVNGNKLTYSERNGQISICVRKNEVRDLLAQSHDCHGHFAGGILMKALTGRFFWPTRARGVYYYCRTCPQCQLVGPLKPSADSLPVIHL